MNAKNTMENLEAENARLREQLAEAENVLHAIRRGEIDAVVVSEPDGNERVFTLQGADHPYRVLVETMSEGAATLGRDGVILYANPRLASLLGTSGEALTGTRLSDWASGPGKEQVERLIRSCAFEAASEELMLSTAAGVALPVRISVNTLVLEDDHYCCAIITDQRLARHHAALEEAAERIREVNDRLRDADQRKDVFLATLAHELRNPLAPIRAAAHVLRSLNGKDSDQARACGIVERQVSHMTRLVDDLLEVSRITLGRLQLQRKTEDLGIILAAVIEGTQSSINPEQHFTVDLSGEPLPIHGDAVRLSQAISNVIENAIKYTPPKGQIELRARRESQHCVVRIRDTGIGISPEAVSRIFEMFTQEERPDKTGNSGLGIGLALTRSIIELHGGTIEASSAGFGQGSEFVIRLPLDASHAAESAKQDEAPAESGSQGILVVDDNVDAADTLCMSLELSGHAARAVYRGAAALAALEEFTPDLVLLDIGLPDIDGYEVARRLRSRFGAACPKLVALSGWGRDEDKQRAAEAGIDAYLTKPVNPDVLSRLVAETTRPPTAGGKGVG